MTPALAVAVFLLLVAAVITAGVLALRRYDGGPRHAPRPRFPRAAAGVHQAPIRGIAQGRVVRVRATESRPAASLIPRHKEGPRAVSAPPPGVHHEEEAQAFQAEALAPFPPWPPFTDWLSDTWVMAAITGGA